MLRDIVKDEGEESMLESKADKAVLQRLYRENAKVLYGIAWRIVQNEAEAEEAVCTCFGKLAEDFSHFQEQDYKKLEILSIILVKNAALELAAKREGNAGKMQGKKPEAVQNAQAQSSITNQEKSSECCESHSSKSEDIIIQALQELEEDERCLMYMKYGLELETKEISKLLDMTPTETLEKLLDCSNKIVMILEAKLV